MPRKPTKDQVEGDIQRSRHKQQLDELQRKYKSALQRIDLLEAERSELLNLSIPSDPHPITPYRSAGKGEATAIAVASDWHVEERVTKAAVNGLNEYNLDIAKKRADEFFRVALHLRNLECQNTSVPRMVIPLLGDFITGDIHEENLVTCLLSPAEATIYARDLIHSGIEFLLKESDLKLVIPCHVGNHARITEKFRTSETELGTSHEFYIYEFLAKYYNGHPRVSVSISQAATSRLTVYDTVFRLQHGHKLAKYQGGVGGLAVPVNRSVLRANLAWRADHDVFGHFHTQEAGALYFANGSLIGWGAYAQDRSLGYQPPAQTYMLVNKRFKGVIDYRQIRFSV